MSTINQIFQTKDNRSVEIIEGNFPDKLVKEFLLSLDDWAKAKFRHMVNQENEYQYFALDHADGRENKIVAYGAVYPKDNPEEVAMAVVLDKEWRGCGLGKLMWKLSEVVAIKHGKHFIRTETDADNENSIKVIKSLGWELYGPIYVINKVLK